MSDMKHLTTAELQSGLSHVCQSPKDTGELALIVRRPSFDEREILMEGQLDLVEGLVGDNWRTRGSSRTKDGSSHPEMQLNVMNVRFTDLVAQDKERWQLAGDQLYVDLDLSEENLPAGTRLGVGTAVIEVTEQPHTGCKKFMARFGIDALTFVSTPIGKQLRLRGLNAKVVQPGTIRAGDTVRKL